MRKLWLFVLCGGMLGAAACERGPATVPASSAAQALGVGAYAIDRVEVQVMDLDAQLLAVLRVSAPTTQTRLVEMMYQTGATYEDEITRPMSDGSFRAPVPNDLAGVIQADPALAPFFAAQRITFRLMADDERRPAIQPEAIASCTDITWPAGCSLYACQQDYDYTDGTGRHTGVTGFANCPAVNCLDYCFRYDKVSKDRYCDDPGSCTQHANGWLGGIPSGCSSYKCNTGQICCEGGCFSGPQCP